MEGRGAEEGLGVIRHCLCGCVRAFVTLQPSPSCGRHLILLIILGDTACQQEPMCGEE